jgi:transcription elongation factor SPT6
LLEHSLVLSETNTEQEEEDLEDDDLELLEENTGTSFKKGRLTRLRRGRSDSPSAASFSKHRPVVESSDDDLDNDIDLPQVQDIQRIWDDDRGDDDDDVEDIDDFITSDEEDEPGIVMDEGAREERRNERRNERRRQEQERRKRSRGVLPELAGIDAK